MKPYQEKLKSLPQEPGVYLYRDEHHRVIYVGKAINLRSRVRSYFQEGANHSSRIAWMVQRIHDIDLFIVSSELESLLLECQFIKRYRPYFNVRYRDDKRFPYLEITTSETYPRIRVVRRTSDSKNRYFGPYPNAGAMRQTLKVIQKTFQIRSCSLDLLKPSPRACLDHHIELCTAPCTRHVSPQEYGEQVRLAINFLEGKSQAVLDDLEQEMKEQMLEYNYERCARIKELIQDIQAISQKQNILFREDTDEDFFCLVTPPEEQRRALVMVLQVRSGRLIQQSPYHLENQLEQEPEAVLQDFLKNYYDVATHIPPQVYLSHAPLPEHQLIESWMNQLRGTKVRVLKPQRGSKKDFLEQGLKAAQQYLQYENNPSSEVLKREDGLSQLAQALGLERDLYRLECIDISNTQGKQSVGSLVVFEAGLPARDQYRKFRIRSKDTPDDFAMIHEVVLRRFRPSIENPQEFAHSSPPDLLVIDGGKGQLSSALEALEFYGLSKRIPLASLAKKQELLFIPGQSTPIALPPHSPAYRLVTALRDEAHRFALSYHRKLRGKQQIHSRLDDIEGIGPQRKKDLLKYFGSFKQLSQASPQEIQQVPGIGEKTAQKIWSQIHR